MVFNDITNKNGIIQTCELLLDLGDAGITSDAVLLKQFTNLINADAYDDVIAEIMKNEGSWTWDDFSYGNSNFPVSSQTLSVVAGSEVNNYALPNAASPGSTDASSFLRLMKVQVKDSAGSFQNILPIDEGAFDQPLETIFANPGFPRYYRQMGISIILYPAPLAGSVTASNGLKITFQRDKVDFVVGDTTKQPGFPSIYHYLLPLIASETWSAIKGLKQLNFITQKKLKFYQNLGWGVANRDKDLKQRITPNSARRNRFYE